jgi:thiol:disulfide interchange protein
MSSTPRFRVIGVAAGLAVFALVAGFFLLSQGQSSSTGATTHTVIPLSKRVKTKHKATAKATPKAKKHVVKPAAKPVAKKPVVTNPGFASRLAAAFAQHRVVVVSLYAPRVELDGMASREAQAGAADAGAGFVALDVLNEGQSRPLTKQLGVLGDPAVLIFRRPGEIVTRFSGFVDKQTVEQAARNAGL